MSETPFAGDSPYFRRDEVARMGFARVGDNVLISRKCSIYDAARISLGDHVRIDDFAVLSGGRFIRIGNRVHIAVHVTLFGGGGINIGDFVNVSGRSAIYSRTDDFSGRFAVGPMVPERLRQPAPDTPVDVGLHCLIGTGSTVLPGVRMAEGSALLAHSLLTKSTKAFTRYFGVPARAVGARARTFLEGLSDKDI